MIDEKRKFSDMYLTDDEEILWYGKPNTSRFMFLKQNIFVVVMSAIGIFNVIVTILLAKDLSVLPMLLVNILVMLLFLWLLRNAFRRNNNRTRYLLTNHRILILDTESSFHQGHDLSEFKEVKIFPVTDTHSMIQFDDKLGLLAIENAEEFKAIADKLINEAE